MAVKFEKKSDGTYMLDVCGYVCPHPQIYAKKSLEKMKSGEIVEIIFDNPSSAETMTQMFDQVGHQLVERKQEDGKIKFKVKKA